MVPCVLITFIVPLTKGKFIGAYSAVWVFAEESVEFLVVGMNRLISVPVKWYWSHKSPPMALSRTERCTLT
jgi:hypothetical protein